MNPGACVMYSYMRTMWPATCTGTDKKPFDRPRLRDGT